MVTAFGFTSSKTVENAAALEDQHCRTLHSATPAFIIIVIVVVVVVIIIIIIIIIIIVIIIISIIIINDMIFVFISYSKTKFIFS